MAPEWTAGQVVERDDEPEHEQGRQGASQDQPAYLMNVCTGEQVLCQCYEDDQLSGGIGVKFPTYTDWAVTDKVRSVAYTVGRWD